MAYVYDPAKQLVDNLNDEMVDVDALDPDDEQVLRSLIEKHVAATDSAVGQRILADWSGQSGSFVKVMPRDYRRVLEAIADAELTGGDVNEAIMAAARG